MASSNDDRPAENSQPEGEQIIYEGRVGAFEMSGGVFFIYDRKNHDAWLQSDDPREIRR